MCIAFWVSFLYIVSNALILMLPLTNRIFKPSTFTRQDTNTPLDLHHYASSLKHSIIIFNAKKALITSENTTHPLSYPFKQQSLFHFLQTGTQKPVRWISKVHPPKWLASFQKNPSRLNYLPLLCLASYVSIPSQSPEQIIRTLTTDNSLQTGKVIITISFTNTKGFLPTRYEGQVWLLFPF